MAYTMCSVNDDGAGAGGLGDVGIGGSGDDGVMMVVMILMIVLMMVTSRDGTVLVPLRNKLKCVSNSST